MLFAALSISVADVRVFVTSQTYQGNLGGPEGADAKKAEFQLKH